MQFLNLAEVCADVHKAIDHFNRRGSGWKLQHIISVTLTACIHRPTQGSSFIETPEHLKNKSAVVNIKNKSDNLCFAWSVLAAIHHAPHHPDRLSHYRHYLDELNLSGLAFPLKVSDVPKFERQNPNISVNVNAYEHDPVPEIIPLYISPDRQREFHVNLLILTDDATGQQHYVLIRHLSRLVCGRTQHDGKTHVSVLSVLFLSCTPITRPHPTLSTALASKNLIPSTGRNSRISK